MIPLTTDKFEQMVENHRRWLRADDWYNNREHETGAKCAHFENVDISYHNLDNLDLRYATFEHVSMPRMNIINTLFNGCKFIHTSAYDIQFTDCDFSDVYCDYTNFQSTKFRGMDHDVSFMMEGTYKKCNFVDAEFVKVDLEGCSFEHCEMDHSRSTSAAMQRVELEYCSYARSTFKNIVDWEPA